MIWIFFLSTNWTFFQRNQLRTSTSGPEPAKKLHLSFPNRIFWIFSHKPHFRNAISHSVRSFKIRSIPMVWIFFLSTNRNFFHGINYEYPPSDRKCKETLSIFPKSNLLATFLTSHISTMLYHIVSWNFKIWSVPIVWIFFLSNKPPIFSTESTIGHPPSDRNRIDTLSVSSKSNLMELFSQATFPQCYNTKCQKSKN